MKLVVCAKSETGTFIGLPSAAGYTVFSVDEMDAVQPGDILASPTWDDEEGLARRVKNLTTNEVVKVRIAAWALTFDESRALVGEDGLKWHPPWPGSG